MSRRLRTLLGRLRGERAEGMFLPHPRQFKGRLGGCKLGLKDMARLITEIPRRRLSMLSRVRPGSNAVGIRTDLTLGLTTDGLELLNLLARADIPHLAAISTMRAADLFVFSEGHARLDYQVTPLLSSLATCRLREFACLNELTDALRLAMNDPWSTLAEVAGQLHKNGVRVGGLATSLDGTVTSQLDMLLLHGGYFAAVPDAIFDAFGIHANDLQVHAANRGYLSSDFDFVSRLDIDRDDTVSEVWDPRLGRRVCRGFKVTPHHSLAWLVRTDAEGWCVDGPSAPEGPVPTAALVEWLNGPHAFGAGAVVVDCAHLSVSKPKADAGGQLRELPYPFDYYLALNSDIDWSTRAQNAAAYGRLADELGLPVAGSLYLRSTSSQWPAAEYVDSAQLERTADATAGTPVDTLHGLQSSINVAPFERDAAGTWRPAAGSVLLYVEGFLASARAGLQNAVLTIEPAPGAKRHTVPAQRATSHPDNAGLLHAYFPLPAALRGGLSNGTSCTMTGNAGSVASLIANDFNPDAVAASLSRLSRRGVCPIVFTAHGGGANVLRFANVHAPEAATVYVDDAVHNLDEERSPYYLALELIASGVRFINPVGRTASSELRSIGALTERALLKDGSPVAFFTRFLSARHDRLGFPGWRFGKSLAHAAALGFQISDAIQQLHWLPRGHGGVLYTHFGHNVGNQVCQRLGWTEETHAAFERLARHYHPDFAEANEGFRLWVGATSSVLLYSWVKRCLRERIAVKNSTVKIKSWHDDVLRTPVPAVERWGTRLLHGITVYVSNAAEAEVWADDQQIVSFTRNPPDETGRESITFVDDSQPLLLFEEGEGEVVTGDAGCIYEIKVDPAPIVGVTHWSFELDASNFDFDVGLRDGRGCTYFAGRGGGRDVVWSMLTPGGGGCRSFTYSLVARDAHEFGPPQHEIVSIVVRAAPGAAGVDARLRRVALLRPVAALTSSANPGVQ